jgi:thiamine-phosphate pyrophosphorylase
MDAAYDERVKLASIAAHLGAPDGRGPTRLALARALPKLFLFTDSARTPDPVETVCGLPPRCGVVYRHYGAPEKERTARALRAACEAGGHILLIAADPDLALAVGAAGVHWPRWMRMPGRVAQRRFGLNTASAHSGVEASRAARAGADIVFLSPVFRSESDSAGAALGVPRVVAIARAVAAPVYALGGVSLATAPYLIGTGVQGIAAVGALAGPPKPPASARF